MVPLGVSHPAANVREEGAEAFPLEIPISNHFFPPLGSGQSKAVPDLSRCAGSPMAQGEGLEAGGGSCPG